MCEFCETIYGLPRKSGDTPQKDCIFQYGDGMFCILIYNGTWVNYHERRLKNINYCPMCGRKLTKKE